MSTKPETEKAEAARMIAGLFASARVADAERRPYVDACLEAGRRLAAFAWQQRHESEQAETIRRALASIYNGSVARRVRLDELRWLDWEHQRDLVAVMFGTGQTGTDDVHIRHAFKAVGGAEAVEWLHSCLDYHEPEHPALAAERVRRVLTEASRAWRTAHGTDYLDRAAKSHVEAKITAAINGGAS